MASRHDWLRDLLRFALEAFLAEDIRDASNGWEALRLVSEYRPDVVLIDMDLPGVGAPEITRCIRRALLHNGPQPAILAFSDRPVRDCVVGTIAAGTDDILCLPFSARFLSRRIVRALIDHRPAARTMPGPQTAGRFRRPEWPTIGTVAADAERHPLLTPEEILALTSAAPFAGEDDGPRGQAAG